MRFRNSVAHTGSVTWSISFIPTVISFWCRVYCQMTSWGSFLNLFSVSTGSKLALAHLQHANEFLRNISWQAIASKHSRDGILSTIQMEIANKTCKYKLHTYCSVRSLFGVRVWKHLNVPSIQVGCVKALYRLLDADQSNEDSNSFQDSWTGLYTFDTPESSGMISVYWGVSLPTCRCFWSFFSPNETDIDVWAFMAEQNP